MILNPPGMQSLTLRHGYAVFQNNYFINNGDKADEVSKPFGAVLGKKDVQ